MNLLITGANGFIGRMLCRRLSSAHGVIGVDITEAPDELSGVAWEKADITDNVAVTSICEKHNPAAIIHCAGIAHQKIGSVARETYMKVNSESTEQLARAAARCNPDTHFVFLSSISVYGEDQLEISRKGAEAQRGLNDSGVGEDTDCNPSSDYAYSKLDAEERLMALHRQGLLRNLTILRLAPVYDREWSLNLDRRVFGPKKMSYLKFGSGNQKMSALARPNLVDFIEYLLKRPDQSTGLSIMNVCDSEPYDFNQIIRTFKRSNTHPNRPTIPIPLSLVWLLTRTAGLLLPNKKQWLHSAYEKLTQDLIFDNTRMLNTNFTPKHTLESIFAP